MGPKRGLTEKGGHGEKRPSPRACIIESFRYPQSPENVIVYTPSKRDRIRTAPFRSGQGFRVVVSFSAVV
jgi:hypothetical protein